MNNQNPWIDRFVPLLDDDAIRSRVKVAPEPLMRLVDLSVGEAVAEMESRLKQIYLPTDQNVRIIRWIIDYIFGCVKDRYSDRSAFLRDVYNPIYKDDKLPSACCLSGLAGVGKSALLEALQKVLPEDFEVDVGEGHDPFPVRSCWYVRLSADASLSDLLSTYVQGLGEENTRPRNLIRRCHDRAFRDGVGLLIADEFQHLNAGEHANALVTKYLLKFRSIGVPFVFSANYSLGHRLSRRPQEDKQRLLSSPIVMLPEDPRGEDWVKYLHEIKRVLGGVFCVDPVQDRAAMFNYSAGLPRLVNNLIAIAYKISRGNGQVVITIEDVCAAYQSLEFTINRCDVMKLNEISIVGSMAKFSKADSHLICPFELPKSKVQAVAEHLQEERERRVWEAGLNSSLTEEERKNNEKLAGSKKVEQNSAKSNKTSNVFSMRTKKPKSADEIIAAAQEFQNSILSKKT